MKNLQKGFVVPLLIGIIALLIAGGGLYIYQNNKKAEAPVVTNDAIQQSNQIQQSTKQNTPVVNSAPISNTLKVCPDGQMKWGELCKPYLAVLSPKNGEVVIKGESFQVTWDFAKELGDALINVYTETEIGVCKIGSASGFKGVVQITLVDKPGCFIPLGQHHISLQAVDRITNKLIVEAVTSGSKSFTVKDTVKPSITILSPNGGEMWQEGNTYQITWTSKNVSVDAPGYVALTKDGNVVRVIRSIAINGGSQSNFGGSFSWTIPKEFVSEASPGKYEILISSSDNTVKDYTDNQFTIYTSGRGY